MQPVNPGHPARPASTRWDVVVVNYHSSDVLGDCLRSLESERIRGQISLRIHIVDNSVDSTEWARLQRLNDIYGFSSLHRSGSNLGFSRACNLGAARGTSPNLLFLNPDTLLLPGALHHLEQTLLQTNGRALVGPSLLRDDQGRWQFEPNRGLSLWGPVADLLYDRGWLGEASLRRLARQHRIVTHPELTRVPTLSGAALAVTRDTLHSLGGWCEEFFLYHEDTDLCLRARRAGIQVLLQPQAKILHWGGVSTARASEAVMEAASAGSQHFHLRHSPRWQRALSRLALQAASLLPRRRDRWLAPILSDPAGLPIVPRASAQRAVAIQIARSPLFDNGLLYVCLPEDPPFEWEVLQSLPPGEYFLRIATQNSGARWREDHLWRWCVPAVAPDTLTSLAS